MILATSGRSKWISQTIDGETEIGSLRAGSPTTINQPNDLNYSICCWCLPGFPVSSGRAWMRKGSVLQRTRVAMVDQPRDTLRWFMRPWWRLIFPSIPGGCHGGYQTYDGFLMLPDLSGVKHFSRSLFGCISIQSSRHTQTRTYMYICNCKLVYVYTYIYICTYTHRSKSYHV